MTETKSIVVERVMAHAPEKVWCALTESAAIPQWLMETDFKAEVGHRFTFRAKPVPGWSGVTHCEVLIVEPPKTLAYRWGDGTESDSGLSTVVTWSLTPTDAGTTVRMEQSGFRPQDESGFIGMGRGWPGILAALEKTVADY